MGLDPLTIKWAVDQARASYSWAGMYDWDALRFPTEFNPGKVKLFGRVSERDGVRRTYWHEAIPSGTRFYLPVLLGQSPETAEYESAGKDAPDDQRILDIFQFVGSHVGLSPWGSRYGYGRFEVEAVVKKAFNTFEETYDNPYTGRGRPGNIPGTADAPEGVLDPDEKNGAEPEPAVRDPDGPDEGATVYGDPEIS